MVGPKTMASHISKTINAAASAAGKTAPMIVGNFPVVVTDHADAIREALGETLAIYGELPSLPREAGQGRLRLASGRSLDRR